LRVLSYNIHRGFGLDNQYDLQRVVDVIESQNPDIICLQEVERFVPHSRNDDQPKILAEQINSHDSRFQANVFLKKGTWGNQILTRWDIEAYFDIDLRYPKKRKQRSAQVARIQTPEGLLQMVNVHLGLNERERHWQARTLLSHDHLDPVLPTLIVGDFNDWRNTLPKASFAEFDFVFHTHPISRFRSFPAWLPMGSLDRAFTRGSFSVLKPHVVRSKLAKAASDHLPLVVDFHLDEHHPLHPDSEAIP